MITSSHIIQDSIAIEKQFAQVDAIITLHRNRAIANVNVENLITCWEIGQYISYQLSHANWGGKVVGDLADYLKVHSPGLRGFGRRNLYNMVKFYDNYSSHDFNLLMEKLPIDEIVQLPTAQLPVVDETVQLPTAQIMTTMPNVLVVTTFTNHVEILNRCRIDEEPGAAS